MADDNRVPVGGTARLNDAADYLQHLARAIRERGLAVDESQALARHVRGLTVAELAWLRRNVADRKAAADEEAGRAAAAATLLRVFVTDELGPTP